VIQIKNRNGIGDTVAAHPFFDHLLPLILVVVWYFVTNAWTPPDASARQWVYGSVATVSGLALAASTFACTMTYQSSNILMTKVRARFTKELRRNWMAVLRSALLTAVMPIVALALDSTATKLSIALTIYAIGLLVTRFLRSLVWLEYTLFMSEHAETAIRRDDVPLRPGL